MRWRDVNTLCRDITLDKFDPQVIVGLSRGGLTPGVMMVHWLQKPFKPVKASLRDFPDWEDYLQKRQMNEFSLWMIFVILVKHFIKSRVT